MEDKLNFLQQRRNIILQGGGTERIEDQHKKGKQTARERLEQFLDPGSFTEVGTFVQGGLEDASTMDIPLPGEGVVTGYGTLDGRLVYVFAQDFTVSGGSLGEMHAAKICRVMDLAAQNGAPFIGINDSGGARIQEGVMSLDGYGNIFFRNTVNSGVIPQISVIMGPSAGGAVYSPALTDFVFMVDNTSYMFITGPQVIKAVTGEEVSPGKLGGAATHNEISGVAHFRARDEQECFMLLKKLLSYLPSNNLNNAPVVPTAEPTLPAEDLVNLVPADPNRGYDVVDVIKRVVDGSEFFQVHEHFAKNAVVGFARIAGQSVGIIANQPKFLAGCLDINSSDKISRFVRFCDCFNIPMVTFVDVPGYLPGVHQEYGGIIRHGAKILYAYSEATVPQVSVILRKAYGGAYIAMNARSLGADYAFAWPTAEIAVMGPEGAINIINRREIEKAENPEGERKNKVNEYRQKFANPYIAAARGWIDDVIDPGDTRRHLIRALDSLKDKFEDRPRKKHGNFPV
ncbi:MAG: methylmalonyl-CoA carboxyltransferase [Dethiobacter sp.]|jgi:propionyl-CoA carboxylase beta chain|nr:MAG: methylmalonyl-CoA carboxyltransferase [Dethiobacter sp.]